MIVILVKIKVLNNFKMQFNGGFKNSIKVTNFIFFKFIKKFTLPYNFETGRAGGSPAGWLPIAQRVWRWGQN